MYENIAGIFIIVALVFAVLGWCKVSGFNFICAAIVLICLALLFPMALSIHVH